MANKLVFGKTDPAHLPTSWIIGQGASLVNLNIFDPAHLLTSWIISVRKLNLNSETQTETERYKSHPFYVVLGRPLFARLESFEWLVLPFGPKILGIWWGPMNANLNLVNVDEVAVILKIGGDSLKPQHHFS